MVIIKECMTQNFFLEICFRVIFLRGTRFWHYFFDRISNVPNLLIFWIKEKANDLIYIKIVLTPSFIHLILTELGARLLSVFEFHMVTQCS